MRATCMHCMRMRYLLMRRQEITLMHASTCSVVSVRQRRPLWTIYLLAAVAAGIWVASLLRCSSECTKTLGDPTEQELHVCRNLQLREWHPSWLYRRQTSGCIGGSHWVGSSREECLGRRPPSGVRSGTACT